MGGKLFVVSPTYEMIYVSSVWLGSQWMRSISFGRLAQSVEHSPRNPKVAGSIPGHRQLSE